MNNKALLSVFVLTLICCASCKKDKETEMVTLKLALEQPTDPSNQKVYLDNQKLVNWYTNDVIVINNGSGTFDASVVNNTANVQAGNGTFTALYPKTTTSGQNNTAGNGTVTVIIPAVQTYVEGSDGMQNLKDLPMAAYLNTSESGVPPVLMFRNLASIIKVTVTNPSSSEPFRVNSIKLSSNVNLHGTYTWDFEGESSNTKVPVCTTSVPSAYGKDIMLDLNHFWSIIAAGESKSYYIVVSPFSSASSIRVDVRGAVVGTAHVTNGVNSGNTGTEAIKVYSKTFTTSSTSNTLHRSRIGNVNASFSGVTPTGGFHVSSTKVSYFSHGNLSVGYNEYHQPTFSFIVTDNFEQYDRVGSSENAKVWRKTIANRSGEYTDLFPSIDYLIGNFWSYQFNAATYHPVRPATDYCDVNKWKCPYENEWKYIINTRSASTINNQINARFAKATVNNQPGLILFPDVYNQPSQILISSINDKTVPFSSNSFNKNKWKLMEAAGAIFLPTTGLIQDYEPMLWDNSLQSVNGLQHDYTYRTMNPDDNQNNSIGWYWTKDGTCLVINNSDINYFNANRAFYFAIRPIRD